MSRKYPKVSFLYVVFHKIYHMTKIKLKNLLKTMKSNLFGHLLCSGERFTDIVFYFYFFIVTAVRKYMLE